MFPLTNQLSPMKPPREIIGEELLRQVFPGAKPTENWYEAGDSIIKALEKAGYIITRNAIRAALEEMVAAHSMNNIGLGASKRRLEAIKQARLVLAL